MLMLIVIAILIASSAGSPLRVGVPTRSKAEAVTIVQECLDDLPMGFELWKQRHGVSYKTEEVTTPPHLLGAWITRSPGRGCRFRKVERQRPDGACAQSG